MNNFKLAIIVLIFLLSSCSKTLQNNGFSNKKIESFDIKIGQTSKKQLLKTYGPPIFENVFKNNVMYYISHTTSYKTFDERKTEKLLVLEVTLDSKNIVQKIKKYSKKDSLEIKISENQENRSVNFTNFWKDIVRGLRRTKTED